jgi:SnoaL-like protein
MANGMKSLLGDRRVAEIVAAFVGAWTNADIDALRTLLAEDAVFSMPPWPVWWRGPEELVAVAAGGVDTCPPSRVTLTRANAQPALAYYARDAETGRYLAAAIDVLTLDGSAIVDLARRLSVAALQFPRRLRYGGARVASGSRGENHARCVGTCPSARCSFVVRATTL